MEAERGRGDGGTACATRGGYDDDREDNMGGTARAHRRSIWTPRPGMSPNWHIHLGQEPNATMAASWLGEQAPGCQLNMP